MSEPVTPIVHLNGTSLESLLEQREHVYCKLGDVFEALKQMAPNGRDYYAEPGRLDKAEEQHRRRMLAVQVLQDEIEAEMTAICAAKS
jgi:hypothetical protein